MLAGRGLYSMQFGNVPFFSMPTLAFNTGDRSGLLGVDGWRADGGIGFRLIWNLVTAVSFDYGLSSEGQIFFMNLGYAF